MREGRAHYFIGHMLLNMPQDQATGGSQSLTQRQLTKSYELPNYNSYYHWYD